MISNEQLMGIIQECAKAGNKVGLRDIAYVILCRHLEDAATAYRILFGLDADYSPEYAPVYAQTSVVRYLTDYMEFNLDNDGNFLQRKKKKDINAEDDISFEENKAEIIKLIKETQDALLNGEIEAKDALKIQADLRVKLNDKFAVREESIEQVVIVNQKYNAVCPHCNMEIARQPISKEDAMAMYDLVEKV